MRQLGSDLSPLPLNVCFLFCLYLFELFQILHIKFALDDLLAHYFKFA